MSTTALKTPPAAGKARGARAARTPEAPDAGLSTTASQLLDVAERLYAQRGLEAVSLREIVAASGQRNLSAAQYHFGSRDALLSLLIARRVHVINLQRHARLDALQAEGRAGELRAVVEATTEALADAVRSQPWGPDYVRVTAQMLLMPSARQVIDGADAATWSGHARAQTMLRALLPDLPDDAFRDRIRILNNETVYALARWVQVNGAVTAATRVRFDALVRHTVDFLAAGLAAPDSATTAAPARLSAPKRARR